MVKLNWDKAGNRYFETGVDRGVLYPETGDGVAWNGLVSVSENPSGGEATPYYSDGIKYLNISGTEEFGGTIEAYTYPDEFAECDGTATFGGLAIHQQPRKPFSLSYRTLVGNDLEGTRHAYKIHIVYNALAAPSQIDFGTVDEDPEALTFSWEFTTTAVDPPMSASAPLIGGITPPLATGFNTNSLTPISHITIDSRKTSAVKMRLFEEILYGTSKTAPKLLSLREVFALMESNTEALNVSPKTSTGLALLIESNSGEGDLIGDTNRGIYDLPSESRLKSTITPGVFTLE